MYTKIKPWIVRVIGTTLAVVLSFNLLNTQAAYAVDLRVLTWNSTGESVFKANELLNEINSLNAKYPATPVKAIFNQEAKAAAGGDIYNMLNNAGAGGIGANYTRPPRHIREMLNNTGAGYNALTHNTIAIATPLTLYDYTTDATFNTWASKLNPSQKTTLSNEVQNFRPPAFMEFTYSGQNVRLITWHAPLGPSGLLGCTTKGGAPLDAFLFLEQSSLLKNTAGVDIVIIAGDLNLTAQDLGKACQGYTPLDDFDGVSSKLDHILAWLPAGGPLNIYEDERETSSSVHDIYSSRVSW